MLATASRSLLLPAALIVATLLLACSSSKPEPTTGLRIADPRSEPHFIVTIEATLQYFDEPAEKTTTIVSFEKPDLWRIVETWRAIPTETIVIVERAWQIQQRESVRVEPGPVRSTSLSFVEALASLDGSDWGAVLGEGPSMGGEPTILVRFEQPNLGDILNQALDDAPASALIPARDAARIRELQRDTASTMLLVVGKTTHRVHRSQITVEGPNQHSEMTYNFDYVTDVFIEPPP